ncbi:MAG TPA: cupin domain-containing protein [Solirubrobacteraceae bacterium]|nr:cupin domain-containing protein [Solirubrobacteraceae bacterium]
MPAPPKIIHLDQLESIPGPGTLTWHPVRLTLGVRAFGCNAYTAGEPGQEVVEPHTEDPKLAHQELYFVAAGRARFTIDGESYDAPAGTYVFVPDPASHRRAVASEPGTTVLSFGGPPTFEPSAWEWSFRAAPLIRTEPERAREILVEGLEAHPESASLHYSVACLEAVDGNRDAAFAALGRAVELKPEAADWARADEDFKALREDPEFRALTALP